MLPSPFDSSLRSSTHLLLAALTLALASTRERGAHAAAHTSAHHPRDCYFVLTAVITDSVSHHIMRIVTSGPRHDDPSSDSAATCRPTRTVGLKTAEHSIRTYLAATHEQRHTEWISIANENPARAADHLVLLARRAANRDPAIASDAGADSAFDGIELIPRSSENSAADPADASLLELPAHTLDDATHARCSRRAAIPASPGIVVRWIC